MKVTLRTYGLILSTLIIASSKSYACYPTPKPPIADLQAVPEQVPADTNVTLDGTASYDPDNNVNTSCLKKGIKKFEWDFYYDGSWDPNYWETCSYKPDGTFDGKTTHSYDNIGIYTVKLKVTDSDNLTGTDTCKVYVGWIFNIDKGTAYNTIQAAIHDANNGDLIKVYPGTYYETVDFNGVSCSVSSTKPNDWDVVAATIIDANGLENVVTFENSEDANAVLRGFTITGGQRGIYCSGASPKIRNCVIIDNHCSGYGGGIHDGNSSSPKLTNCFFVENDAARGEGCLV